MPTDVKQPQTLTEIQKILEISHEKLYRKGDMIFEEGQDDHSFYIILMGNVEISKKTSEGNPKVIAHLGAGEFLGEGVLAGRINKPASARAVVDTSLMTFAYDDFKKLTEDEPKTAVNFLLSVLEAGNERLVRTNEKLLALFEISKLLNMYRDDLNQLASGLVNRLMAIIESKDGVLLLKNPFQETYRVIYSTNKDLTVETFKEVDVTEPQKIEINEDQYLIVSLKDLGILALRREKDFAKYDSDQLNLLALIGEQAANTIKDASEKVAEKAKKMLERKHFEL